MKNLIKQLRPIIVIVITLIVGLPVLAHDFEVDGIYYDITDGINKVVEVAYQGDSYSSYLNEYSGDVIIPSAVNYNGTMYSVASIGGYAFAYCSGLTSVLIPSSVTSIGDYAFWDCSMLVEVSMPNSVAYIGSFAFDNTGWYNNQSDGILYLDNFCLGYKGDKPTDALILKEGTRLIGPYAFWDCDGLTSVVVPNSVTSIGDYAFTDCSGLTSVVVPNSVTSIGDYAFTDCSGLTSVSIPNSVSEIGDGALYNTGWYINQPNGILYLDKCCLGYKGNKPIDVLILEYGTRLIGDLAFINCEGIAEVKLPNSITSIGNRAFHSCVGLKEVTIPNSVTSIGDYAFADCLGLTSVTIGNSVTSIGSYAFVGCSGITKVNILDLSAWCKIGFSNLGANPLYYAHHLYLNGLKITDLVILDDIKQVKNYAFVNCAGLSSVTIPNSVTEIGCIAFNGCSGLTSVSIPNSVTFIGEFAFARCSLDVVTSYCETPPLCELGAFSGLYSASLFVPEGVKDAYLNATEWKNFINIQEIAGVDGVKTGDDVVEVERYDIHGRLLTEPTQGINIVKMNNGTTRKEVVN